MNIELLRSDWTPVTHRGPVRPHSMREEEHVHRNADYSDDDIKAGEKGLPKIALCELNAYIELKIAISSCPLNGLWDYWSTNALYNHPPVQATIQKDRFFGVRVVLTLHSIDTIPEEVKIWDPLWDCRSILNNIFKESRTLIASKPDKYAVRFYALVDWKPLYVHGLFDNCSGDNTAAGLLDRYTAIFPVIHSLHANSATALLVVMLAHQNQQSPSPSGKRAHGDWKLVAVIDTAYNVKEAEKAHKQC
ncbi:hypothetical protein GN958_ATG18191 [Phytophthora infestans]|uniref:Uncharacterized protein n=1 Tax=Phytophthora infestans TaxID=4787 RepID=A0A8S9U117_PHYIN|nr:hypothetical protein GN958_ATG18191 [Phytophthora infestans]